MLLAIVGKNKKKSMKINWKKDEMNYYIHTDMMKPFSF